MRLNTICLSFIALVLMGLLASCEKSQGIGTVTGTMTVGIAELSSVTGTDAARLDTLRKLLLREVSAESEVCKTKRVIDYSEGTAEEAQAMLKSISQTYIKQLQPDIEAALPEFKDSIEHYDYGGSASKFDIAAATYMDGVRFAKGDTVKFYYEPTTRSTLSLKTDEEGAVVGDAFIDIGEAPVEATMNYTLTGTSAEISDIRICTPWHEYVDIDMIKSITYSDNTVVLYLGVSKEVAAQMIDAHGEGEWYILVKIALTTTTTTTTGGSEGTSTTTSTTTTQDYQLPVTVYE
jgi:hypothetical protein